MDIVEILKNQIEVNEYFQGTALVALLMSLLYQLKELPRIIWIRLRRLIVYTVTVEESDALYSLLSQYLATNFPKKLRNVEASLEEKVAYGLISGSRYEHIQEIKEQLRQNVKPEIKLTHHSDLIYIMYKGNILLIQKSREKLENAQDFKSAYMGRVSISGIFAKRQILSLLKECQELLPDARSRKGRVKKHALSSDMHYPWSDGTLLYAKGMDCYFIDNKQEILDAVDNFTQREAWYLKRGINYSLGILLHGEPGVGKTELAKSLALYLGRDLYFINIALASDDAFRRGFRELPAGSVVLIDDVDIGLQTRDEAKTATGTRLSTVLSCMDGMDSVHDVIIILTTNHIEKLDPALIRQGRIDLSLEVGYPTKDTIESYMSNFYEEEITLPSYSKKLTMAAIQDICIKNEACEAVKVISSQQ